MATKTAALRILSVCLLVFTTNGAAAERPNVIVIMADDLGAEGLGCYGSSIYTTPHLDRMASEGMRFNNAYATPLCTPTRVMLMSGLYANRTGFRALISKNEGVRLPPSIRTFAHDFRDAGYKTAVAGKWQLGKFNEFPEQLDEHGFDEYCMWTWVYDGKKSSRYYKPQIYSEAEVTNHGPEDYGPDFYSNHLLSFIDRNKDQPFFIYYPMALVHSPFMHPPKLKELASTKFTEDLDKDTVAFGHMITYMDAIVGQIAARLTKHGIDKNTVILFTGDNGTSRKITSKLGDMELAGGKGTMTEAGTRVPLLAWWPGRIEPSVNENFFCLVDVLPTIASIANIKLNRTVDGMDLSHNLMGGEGESRKYVMMSYRKEYFVRDARFRLHDDGRLYDVPVTSNGERYSEKQAATGFLKERQRLTEVLNRLMSIEQIESKAGNEP
ncbi:MAG: sulfatase-like hydrolase/transferase [Planctomycetota bacterium]